MLRSRTAFLLAPLLAPLLALGGCDESDVVAVRIRLRDDLSGSVRTSGLRVPQSPGPIQADARGATFDSQVDVSCASGSFGRLSDLKLADIEFKVDRGEEGIGVVRVVIPRGQDARWPKVFVPLSPEERKGAVSALDPTGRADAIGTTIKLEVELPAAVVGNGLTGKPRGTKSSTDGPVATLVVPIDSASLDGEPIVWHLTWQG